MNETQKEEIEITSDFVKFLASANIREFSCRYFEVKFKEDKIDFSKIKNIPQASDEDILMDPYKGL